MNRQLHGSDATIKATSVDATFALARAHCAPRCEAIHALWPVLRLLDLNTTPAHHSDFYCAQLVPRFERGARRVLVSGAADHTMLAVVLEAAQMAGITPEITVIDRCHTPLALCQQFAATNNVLIASCAQNVLDHSAEPYDLIVTHSFLGQFDDAARTRLARCWHVLLVPGGAVVSVNRLRPHANGIIGFTNEQRTQFVQTLLSRLDAGAWSATLDRPRIALLAERYIASHAIHPIRDQAALAELCAGAGLAFEHVEQLPAATGPQPAGPTLRGNATYAGFVAARPPAAHDR